MISYRRLDWRLGNMRDLMCWVSWEVRCWRRVLPMDPVPLTVSEERYAFFIPWFVEAFLSPERLCGLMVSGPVLLT